MSNFNDKHLKIIGFDSWTGGSKFYKQLVDPLKMCGCRLKLIHLGSWGVDKGRPKEETLDGLSVCDIAYYRGRDFIEILDYEKPDAVLFLSTGTFAHRAFNRLCRMRKIPTILQYHGLMRALADNSGTPYQFNFFNQFLFVITRVHKMLSKTWPAYMSSLWTTRASCSEWLRFVKDNIDFALGRQSSPAVRGGHFGGNIRRADLLSGFHPFVDCSGIVTDSPTEF